VAELIHTVTRLSILYSQIAELNLTLRKEKSQISIMPIRRGDGRAEQPGYGQNGERSKRRQVKTATNQNGCRSKVNV